MPSRFVQATNANGEIQRIPPAWLKEDSPFYGQFTQTPSARQEEARSATPDETWTVRQLRDHVDGQGIEVPRSAAKADYLSAIHDRASGSTTITDSQEG